MTQIIKTYKDKISFGKYKGELFEQVLTKDINYIDWCLENKVLDIQNEDIIKVVNCLKENKNGYVF